MSSTTLIASLYVFALAAFLGYQVISRVPPLLHTPLMSATNAISGISLVGSIVTAGADYPRVCTILGFIAVVCSTTLTPARATPTSLSRRTLRAVGAGDPASFC